MVVNQGLAALIWKLALDTDFDFKAHLMKADPGPILATTVLSAFTEADFPGYAAIGGTLFASPVLAPSGEVESEGASVVWTRAAGAGSQTIYGWYWDFKDRTDVRRLLFAELFSPPEVISVAGETVVRALNIFAKTY